MLGSCVSGGPYYRLRSPDLHMDVCRTGASLISLMSPPMGLDPADLEPLSPYDRRRLEGDINRTALDFLEHAADFYLLDLGDETCDLLHIGDSFVTDTSALRKSPFLSRRPDLNRLRRHDPASTRLWLEACTRFCRGPLAAIPQDRIILHRVQLASEDPSTNGRLEHAALIRNLARGAIPWLRRLPLGRPISPFIKHRVLSRSAMLESLIHDLPVSCASPPLNPILETYFQHLRGLLPHAHVIDVPDQHRRIDPAHRFGYSALHYTEDYDQYFIAKLRDLTGRILATA